MEIEIVTFVVKGSAKLTIPTDWQEQIQVGSRSVALRRVFDLKLRVGWLLVVLRINVDLAIFQPYLDLEAGDNQSLKIQVARPGIESRSSCSASQELNHSATAAPLKLRGIHLTEIILKLSFT